MGMRLLSNKWSSFLNHTPLWRSGATAIVLKNSEVGRKTTIYHSGRSTFNSILRMSIFIRPGNRVIGNWAGITHSLARSTELIAVREKTFGAANASYSETPPSSLQPKVEGVCAMISDWPIRFHRWRFTLTAHTVDLIDQFYHYVRHCLFLVSITSS